jgi:hypothetical protein
MKMYHIKGIKWDTDGAKVELPHECLLDIYDDFDVENDAADVLSEHFGFSVDNFYFTEVPEEMSDAQFEQLRSLKMIRLEL